jgi:hypothetical protein
VGAVTDAALALVKDIERLQQAGKLDQALTDQQFGEHLIGLLAALYATAASAVGFRSPEAAKPGAAEAKWWAESVLPTLVEMAQIGPQLVRLGDIYTSDMPDEQRAAAYGDAVEKIIERITNAAAGLAGAKDDKRNERKTEAQGKMREALSEVAAEKRARDQDKRYKAAEKKALPAAKARAEAERVRLVDQQEALDHRGVWFTASEVGLGARYERGEGGVSKSVEYDIPRRHSNKSPGGVDTRKAVGKFHATHAEDTGDAAAMRPRDVTPTPLEAEQSHGIPQAASAANIDPAIGFGDWSQMQIAKDLMDLRNIWAARGLGAQGVNQRTLGGKGGVEERIAKFAAANPDKGLRCRIEPDFGSGTTKTGKGRPVPIPDVFEYKVFDTSRPGQNDLLIHVRVLNIPGTPPQIVKAPKGF